VDKRHESGPSSAREEIDARREGSFEEEGVIGGAAAGEKEEDGEGTRPSHSVRNRGRTLVGSFIRISNQEMSAR